MPRTRFTKHARQAPVAELDGGFAVLYDPDDFVGQVVYLPDDFGGGQARIVAVGRIPCPHCESRHNAKAWQLEGDLLLVECLDTERFFWCRIAE